MITTPKEILTKLANKTVPEIQISIKPVPLDQCLDEQFRRNAIALEAKHRAAPEMYEALKDLAAFYEQDDENHFTRFERVGEWFQKETGYLRPGKDSALHDPEVRQAVWDKWVDGKIANARAALAKAEGRQP